MTVSKAIGTDVVTLVRADDQLLANVVMEGLHLVEGGLTTTGTDPGFLTIVLPPQHTQESISASELARSRPLNNRPGPINNRVSGPSQLRFEIAPGTVIPYTVEGLLGWTDRTLVLDARGAVSGGPYPTDEPSDTFLEMPQALYLSPGVGGRFVTQAEPRTFGSVTELWRMRLGRERNVDGVAVVLEPPDTVVHVRAIWTDDHEADVPAAAWSTTPEDEFQRLPTRLDERFLVRAMGDHDMDDEYPAHEAATITKLWLSLTGGWLTVDGSFTGSGVVAAWAQRITTGRDVNVRVTHRGWLAPFGNVASVVLIADRVFEVDSGGGVTARLRQREFISVSPNTVDVGALAGSMLHAGRELPFRTVDLVSNFVAEVDQSPIPHDDDDVDDTAVFIPTDVLDSAPLTFDYMASDRVGQLRSFTIPGVFIRVDATDADVAAVIAYYADTGSIDTRTTDLGGQPVGFADEPAGSEGDGKTTVPTWEMTFSLGEPTAPVPGGFAPLVPSMHTAAVRDDKVDTLRGQDAEPFAVHMAEVWLEHGADLGTNIALGFLDLDVPFTLPFSGGGSGITAPDLKVEQLTALLGPSIKLLEGDDWDPVDALGDTALFMGSVKLAELIEKFNVGGDVLAARGLPRYDIELHRPDPQSLPDALCISLTWNPPLKSFQDTLLVAQDIRQDSPFPDSAEGELDFLLKLCIPLDDLDAEPETTVDVAVRNIMIQLPPPNPIIAVAFSTIRFSDPPDGSADVDVDIAAVRFLGSLTFLQPIQEFLAGLGGGPRIDIRDDVVEADLTLPLPDISLGVLGITGLEVGTGLVIDLTGGPLRAAFNLGTRSDPFTLSVMGFGGSGSIELEASPHPVGIVRLELSLAFVIELSIDVVVAKGSLRASFGASLELEAILVDGEVSSDVTLGAFLDIVGEVQVLGLISIVVQVLLTLEYTASTGVLVGEATVTASVDVGFIEKEVSFTISQELALGDGSGAQAALARSTTGTAGGFITRFPTPGLWNSYCAAFAT